MTWLSVERKTAVRPRTPRETEAQLASRPPAGHDSHLPVQAPRPPPQARCFQVGRRDPPKLAWWEGQGHCPLGTLSPVSTRSPCQVPRARARPRSHTGTTGGTHQTLVKVPSPTPDTGVTSRHQNVTKKREMHTGGALSCVYTRNVPETSYTPRKGGRKRGRVPWGPFLAVVSKSAHTWYRKLRPRLPGCWGSSQLVAASRAPHCPVSTPGATHDRPTGTGLPDGPPWPPPSPTATLSAPHRSTHPLSYPAGFHPSASSCGQRPPTKRSPLSSTGPGWETATAPGPARAVGTAGTLLLPGRVGATSGLD